MFSLVCALAALPLTTAVQTPFGERSAKCVVEIPDGASVIRTESGVSLQLATGEVQEVEVPQECHEDGVVERLAAQRQGRLTASSPMAWLDNQGYTYNPGFGKFTGSFNVPANPPSPTGQILYYFFGMENLEGGEVNILQPVLTWGEGNGWSLWSWACCPSNITTHSRNIGGLREGMKVDGNIYRKNSDTWVVDSAFKDDSGDTKHTTLTAQVGSFQYNWADVTLEVYSISSCAQHSPGKVTFENLEISDAAGSKLTPEWTGATRTSCGGVMTVEDAATISIQHSTGTSVVV